MLTLDSFRTILASYGHLIVDGGLATELESQGHNLNHALWSAKLLKENPEAIKKIHLDYYLAGANITITASYQASTKGFRDHFGLNESESKDLIKRCVDLARKASGAAGRLSHDASQQSRLVAGSVGPYGAFLSDGSEYRGDYRLAREELKVFHRPRIQALVDADVDLLALETIPQLAEIEAILELLRDEFPDVIAWVSCTLVDAGHISDGTCIEQVLRVVNQYQDVVVAFGVNCVPVELVTEALQLMRRRTKLPLLCYANSGEVWDADRKTWSNGWKAEQDWAVLAREWRECGARLIGGCCRTGPGRIKEIAHALATGSDGKAESRTP